MIYDYVNKGHTNLNMFSVCGEQIRSLSSKQSKLNFWNQLHPKIVFVCRFWTKTATWKPNHTILTSSVTATLKAMTDTVILDKALEWQDFFLFTERVLWGWLARPSHDALEMVDKLRRFDTLGRIYHNMFQFWQRQRYYGSTMNLQYLNIGEEEFWSPICHSVLGSLKHLAK